MALLTVLMMLFNLPRAQAEGGNVIAQNLK